MKTHVLASRNCGTCRSQRNLRVHECSVAELWAPPLDSRAGTADFRMSRTTSAEHNKKLRTVRPKSYDCRNGPRVSLARAPLELRVQNVGARGGLELARVHSHGEQSIVTDTAGQLDEAAVAEALTKFGNCRVVHAVIPHETLREVDDLGILGRHAAGVPLANRRYGGLGYALTPRTSRLCAPYVHRVELASYGHRREDAHAHVEAAFETHVGSQVRHALGQLGSVEEHRERALQAAAALDDAVDDGVGVGRHLVLAGDGSQSRHGSRSSMGVGLKRVRLERVRRS